MISRISLLKCKEGVSEEAFREGMMGGVRDVIARNGDRFRLMGPDETASNRLDAVFDVTDRVYQALRETMTFTSVGTVNVDGHDEPIWRLVEPR